MNPALYYVFLGLFAIGLAIWGYGTYSLMRDEARKKVTGHWVEHHHRVLGHMIPWVQPVSSGTAASNIVDICSGFGFKCVPGEKDMFNEPRRTARHRDTKPVLPAMLGRGSRIGASIRRRTRVPNLRRRKEQR